MYFGFRGLLDVLFYLKDSSDSVDDMVVHFFIEEYEKKFLIHF